MSAIDTQSASLDFGRGELGDEAMLRVSELHPDPDQPRRHFDEDALEELAQSMSMVGLLQRIGVRRDGRGWMIIYGERRWRAACLLGWNRIAVREYRVGGPAKLVLQACENMHRAELTLEENATTVLRLVEAGMPIAAVARALGRREAWAGTMLSIARDPLARALVDAGRLHSADAWEEFTALVPAARKLVLDSTDPVTGPRCMQAREKVLRAEEARQASLLPAKDRPAPQARSVPQDAVVQEAVQVAADRHQEPGATAPAVSPGLMAVGVNVEAAREPAPQAALASPAVVPVSIPVSLCRRLAPAAGELLDAYAAWYESGARGTLVDDACERLPGLLMCAIEDLLTGARR